MQDILKVIEYWQTSAERDYETMVSLFEIKRYPECLFFGHLVLEKILKALVVQNTSNHAPCIHNLLRLQEIAKLTLNENEEEILGIVNQFNIKTRYPDYKMQFYQGCTFDYTQKYYHQIQLIYKKLCQEIK